ncbi:MAG: DUF6561 domain-containing protein [Candidatus Nanopelagicaceae bacterium]|jgi:hypothetical protein
MEKLIKILALTNNTILISEIVEVGADVGEPDCKLTNPFVVKQDQTMEPFLFEFTAQDTFMISSDKILTLADPTETLLSKYFDLTA